MNKYILLPANSDLNRGDQALVWETKRVAEKAGYNGEFFMLADGSKSTKQSQEFGIRTLQVILKHPSRKFKPKSNHKYTVSLIIKWGTVAFVDLISSMLLLNKFTRSLIYPFLSDDVKNTLKFFKECNACFVKGGGFIHSYGKITDLYTTYYAFFHIWLAQSFGKPIYVMPNSFGPFNMPGTAWLTRKILNRCKLVTVRESKSLVALQKLGINATMFPDLGFFLEKDSNQPIPVKQIRAIHPERKLVAITARPYRFPGETNPDELYRYYIKSMAEFSRWLYSENYLPIFVEHTLSETTHESDENCIMEITSKLEDGKFLIISDENYTCKDLKAIYGEVDYIVGTRFHSIIFSFSELIPGIAITYGGNKGEGIMHDLGLSDYAIPMHKIDSDNLIKAFIKLCKKTDDVRLQLKNKKLDMQTQYQQLIDSFKVGDI